MICLVDVWPTFTSASTIREIQEGDRSIRARIGLDWIGLEREGSCMKTGESLRDSGWMRMSCFAGRQQDIIPCLFGVYGWCADGACWLAVG